MRRFGYFAMTAVLAAGLSMTAFAQTSGSTSKTQAKTATTAAKDPCQSQKDTLAADTKAKKDKKTLANDKTAVKTCQTNQQKAAQKKTGGK